MNRIVTTSVAGLGVLASLTFAGSTTRIDGLRLSTFQWRGSATVVVVPPPAAPTNTPRRSGLPVWPGTGP